MENYEKLKATVEAAKEQLDKFFEKGNESAGVRARKILQDVKKLAQEIRVEIHTVRLERKEKKQ